MKTDLDNELQAMKNRAEDAALEARAKEEEIEYEGEIEYGEDLEPVYGKNTVTEWEGAEEPRRRVKYSSQKEKDLADEQARRATKGLMPFFLISIAFGLVMWFLLKRFSVAFFLGVALLNFMLGAVSNISDARIRRKGIPIKGKVIDREKHDGWQELVIEYSYNGETHQQKIQNDSGIKVGSRPNLFYMEDGKKVVMATDVSKKTDYTMYYLGLIFVIVAMAAYGFNIDNL